jgi:hypothetical protein
VEQRKVRRLRSDYRGWVSIGGGGKAIGEVGGVSGTTEFQGLPERGAEKGSGGERLGWGTGSEGVTGLRGYRTR